MATERVYMGPGRVRYYRGREELEEGFSGFLTLYYTTSNMQELALREGMMT